LLWDVHYWGRRRTEIGKDSRARRLGGELGASTVSFIGLVRQVVALDRGAYPKKIGRWKGFLDQAVDGSLGILG
jgi:hypothetical protein